MNSRAAFIVLALLTLVLVPMQYGQAETIYIENDKGSDTMILRTKPQHSEPRARREYSDAETLLIAPSIQLESSSRHYLPDRRPPKPPHKPPHWHNPTKGPDAPSRPYRPSRPRE